MVAPEVALLNVTVCAAVYVPADGLKVGDPAEAALGTPLISADKARTDPGICINKYRSGRCRVRRKAWSGDAAIFGVGFMAQ
jgi:hypothetical protein